MAYFLFMIDLNEKKEFAVGGGDVELSKILKLRDFDAQVTALAKDVLVQIQELKGVKMVQKIFEENDLKDDFFLVVAATNDRELNIETSLSCREKNILVNVVDDPERSSFVFPATLRCGKLTVAVSSGGVAPQGFDRRSSSDNIGEFLDFVAKERANLKKDGVDLELRKKIVRFLWDKAVEKGRSLTAEEKFRVVDLATKEKGFVSLVGAVAGDASLATIRATRKLKNADVVLYAELIDKKLLDYASKTPREFPSGREGASRRLGRTISMI